MVSLLSCLSSLYIPEKLSSSRLPSLSAVSCEGRFAKSSFCHFFFLDPFCVVTFWELVDEDDILEDLRFRLTWKMAGRLKVGCREIGACLGLLIS